MKSIKLILYILFIATYSVFCQNSKFIYEENFNNKGTWPAGNNEFRELKVFNGRYYFEHKRTDKSWRISTTEFNLDTSKDFEIETSIQKISGVENSGIQFLYDYKNDKNYKEFGFTSNGYFRIAESINNSYSNIKPWTKSEKVKTGNYGVNNLKIVKKGNSVTFFINKSEVFTNSFKNFVGKKMAISIFKNQKISVDYIKVKQNTTTLNKRINSNFILNENFNSNNNSWATQNNETAILDIKDGNYYFDYKDTKGYTSTKTIYLEEHKDFRIEANFQKINGIQNNGFGLIFGRLDGGNQNQFFISPSGSFAVDEYKNGNLNSLKKWTSSEAINKGNFGKNKLTIEKKENAFHFYINNTKVHTAYNLVFYGKKIGFVVFDKQKIAIDNFSISYLNENTNSTNGTLILNENFNTNNTNNWTQANDNNKNYRLTNGKYYLENKKKENGSLSYIDKYIDSNNDFEIETSLEKIVGEDNSPYGILWGKKNENYFSFLITNSGFFKVNRVVNNKIETIVKWTKIDGIKSANGVANIVNIKKEGNFYSFKINNKFATKIDFEPFFGNEIGYGVYYQQEIATNYLKVNYLKKSTTNIIANKTLSLPLYDSFNGNNNNWNMEDSDDYSAKITNGKLVLHKKKKGGIFVKKDVDINTSKNFIIETAISKLSNSTEGLYGITFGRKNSANEYTFLFSNNGSYMYRKFDNNVYKKIIPFTESSAIKTGINQSNKVKIVKSDDLLRFYINDIYVNEAPFEPFFGNRFGYTVYYDKKIAIDYLDIKYQTSTSFNNPPIVVITEPNVEVKRGFKIVQAKRIKVRGKATDIDGIYEITVNGVEANVAEDGTFTANVPLKYGKNDLVVKATDLKQASSIKTFTIKRNSPEIDNSIISDNTSEDIDIGFGKYYALVIGVSTYKDKKIEDLKGEPTKDAQKLADVLINNYSFAKENVTILKNPTENQIIKEFFQLKKKVGKNDNLVIFYAGHGNYDKKSEKGYWMPSDTEMAFEGNVILNTSIVSYIKSINSKHTLLISDACFSGSILTKTRSYKDASNAVKAKYSLTSRKAITSGALETVPNKSVFMEYLVKKLKENKKKYLSAGQLFNMIEDPVINNPRGDEIQRPIYAPISRTGDEGGDFIFIKRN